MTDKLTLTPTLIALKYATDAAIRDINTRRIRAQLKGAAVNWADLRCVDAQQCVGLDGVPFYRVSIEEASPDNPAFRSEVARRLRPKWGNVEVATEW